MSKDLVRLQKHIADCGVTSRRKAEKLIEEGKVKVNGRIVLELGTKVNPGKDVVSVNGNYLDYATVEQIYLVMNKPRSCVTTLSDPEGEELFSIIAKKFQRESILLGDLIIYLKDFFY